MFIKIKQNDKSVRLFQVYKVVNGFLFCTAWQVNSEETNFAQLLTNASNSFAMNVVNSLTGTVQNNRDNGNNTKEQDFTINNINEEYSNNKISERLIKMLHIYSDTVISDDKRDPFWTDTAKNVLEIIILTDLITKNSVSSSELVQQVKDSNIIKTNIKANLEKLSNPKINGIISSKSIIDSEKPFESVMDIIRKSLLKQYSTEENKTKEKEAPVKKTKQTKIDNSELNTKNVTDDNLKEYSQEIPNYPTFKFYFPESMGEYCKQKDNVFELKKDNIQKIRVMISKCSSEENLEADAKKWIEFNKKETSMEYVSYIKEKIKNIPIEVYELRKIGKIGTRIYKIGYVNGCRITISGGKVKGKEQIINQAFEKITWVDNTEKKVKPTNPIIIDCPACNSNFELKWNVPDTEKTFYCKCPNCGMELKRGNPNYKGKEKTTISNTNNKDKIITYLINVLKQTEKRANTSFEKLNQYEDIVNEFAGCINEEQFNYCDNGIMVEGYTAKSLKEKVGNKLNNLGVYNYLIYLRENPDEAKQNLAKGLPVK